MKRLLIVAAMLALVFGVVYAQPADTATAPEVTVVPGVQLNMLIDKDIKGENTGLKADLSAQNYDVIAAIKLGDLVDLTPKIGLSTLQIGTSVFGTDVNLESGVGLNMGIDAALHAYKGKVDVDLIGGYLWTRADIDDVEIGALEIDNPLKTIVNLHQWELGLKVSKDLAEYKIPVTPYIGVVYSDLVGNIDTDLSLINLEEDLKTNDHVGLRIGASVKPMNNLVISLEGKLIDQEAIIATATYKF